MFGVLARAAVASRFALTAHRTAERLCSHDIETLPFQLRRLFCVLSRYETLSATSDGYQMAFPASGFRLLRHLVSVDCECFASPLNCTLSRFCSVAYDTDKFFGSEGNFFQSEYQQANPPFVEEVMERMVDHMHYLLRRATGPMSFAVIVPGWDDDGCLSYQNMKNSRFARPHPGERLPVTAANYLASTVFDEPGCNATLATSSAEAIDPPRLSRPSCVAVFEFPASPVAARCS
ncbi:unnamed protein product [Ectocarpus sp. CCAP 1310/34]|nr:unnamed protein product [Ectocarpus sp. CCAP 1310/34]